MLSNSWKIIIFLIFISGHCITANQKVKFSSSKLLVLPFRNKGAKEFNHYSEIFPQNLFAQFRFIPNHEVVNPEMIKPVLIKKTLLSDKINDSLINFSRINKITHIIKGDYREKNNTLNISFKILETKSYKIIYQAAKTGNGGIHSLHTIDKIVNEMVKFLGIKLEFGNINISAEKKCRILIDGEDFGHTPVNMQLIAGEHTIQAIYSPDKDTNYRIYANTLNLNKLENKNIFIKINATLNIMTDLPCKVMVDNEYESVSPCKRQIICGKAYSIKVIYEKHDNTQEILLDKHITGMNGRDIKLRIPVSGTIHMKNTLPAFAVINKQMIHPLPHTFTLAPFRINKVKAYIKDYKWKQTFTFFSANIILLPGNKLTYELALKEFKKNWSLCLLPAAAQIHNFQYIKATVVLSLFTTFSAIAALSPLFAYLNYKFQYEPMLQEWNDKGSAGKYSRSQIEEVRYNAGYVLQISLLPALAGMFFTWLYSLIDGAVLMHRLHKLLYPERHLKAGSKTPAMIKFRPHFKIHLTKNTLKIFK